MPIWSRWNEALYRAGRTRLAASFCEICDALLPLFVEMIQPPPGFIADRAFKDDLGEGVVVGDAIMSNANGIGASGEVLGDGLLSESAGGDHAIGAMGSGNIGNMYNPSMDDGNNSMTSSAARSMCNSNRYPT